MLKNALSKSRTLRQRGEKVADRAVDAVVQVLVHEASAASAHIAEVKERWAVARKAQGLVELCRDQLDLFPETRLRLQRDQKERRALVQRVSTDLRRSWANPSAETQVPLSSS